MNTIAVVDCGMGNLHSVVAGLKRAVDTVQVHVTQDKDVIANADRVVLPGDGHFDACMREIKRLQLADILRQSAQEKPFLGICVGMQVLCCTSAEGGEEGLGVLPLSVEKIPHTPGIKVPHMGWNATRRQQSHPLIDTTPSEAYFYYIHSYYVATNPWTLMTTMHGVTLSAVIGRGKLVATQFHPEKSGADGVPLLRQFAIL